MARNLISVSLLFLFVLACVGKPTYESATKWYSECEPYPGYHPGDWYAYEDICIEECTTTVECDMAVPGEYGTCATSLNSCQIACIEKIHPIAKHVEGGYYSDGSYFAQCYYFENIHPTKDKYKKTKWQTDRDECIDHTFQNVKPKLLEKKGGLGFINRAKHYYQSCLEERGYRG